MTHAQAKILADQHVELLQYICRATWRSRWREVLGEAYVWAVRRLEQWQPERMALEKYLWYVIPRELRRSWAAIDGHRHAQRPPAAMSIDEPFWNSADGHGMHVAVQDTGLADLEAREWYQHVRASVACQGERGQLLMARAQGEKGSAAARRTGRCESRVSQMCRSAAAAVRESVGGA